MNRSGHNNKPKQAKQPKGNYAFIDSQNLNLGVQKIGWKMDWRKFRIWLEEKYNVTHAFMFIGYMAENESLYELMHGHGFLVVLKPTLEVKAKPEDKATDASLRARASESMAAPVGMTNSDEKPEPQKPVVKGNIDADLVLYAMKELPNYDKALIVSGDGDFFALAEYLIEQGRLEKILAPNQRYSTLLKGFEPYIEGLDQHRRELAYRDHYGPRRK